MFWAVKLDLEQSAIVVLTFQLWNAALCYHESQNISYFHEVLKDTRLACVRHLPVWSVTVWTSSFISPRGSILVSGPPHPALNCTLTVKYCTHWLSANLPHQCRSKALRGWPAGSSSDMFEATWLRVFIVLSVCFDLSAYPAIDMNVQCSDLCVWLLKPEAGFDCYIENLNENIHLCRELFTVNV